VLSLDALSLKMSSLLTGAADAKKSAAKGKAGDKKGKANAAAKSALKGV
jgi:hypothetical protein